MAKNPDSSNDDAASRGTKISRPDHSLAAPVGSTTEQSSRTLKVLSEPPRVETFADPQPPRSVIKNHACPFFSLPGEIRQQIYDYNLLERPKWEKPHKATCPYHPARLGRPGRPPFMLPPDHCRCAARQGLALLVTCRRIHAEAAPCFWAGNVHCFDRVAQVAQDIGSNLRDEYRVLLRDVRILSDFLYGSDYCISFDWDYRYYSLKTTPLDMQELAWRALRQCSDLQTLVVPFSLAQAHPAQLRACAADLPRLLTMRLVTCTTYYFEHGKPEGTLKFYDTQLGTCLQSTAVYYLFGGDLDLSGLISGDVGDEEIAHMVNVCTLPWMPFKLGIDRVMGYCRDDLAPGAPWSYPFPLKDDLDEVAFPLEVWPPDTYGMMAHGGGDGSPTTVVLYGLPVRESTIDRMTLLNTIERIILEYRGSRV